MRKASSNFSSPAVVLIFLLNGSTYIIRVGSADWTGGVGVGDLAGLSPTLPNVGGGGQPDVRDSDVSIVGSAPEISVVTGAAGENNHTLDMGFRPLSCTISGVTATPGACVPATNQYTLTGSVTFTNAPGSGTLTVQIAGGGQQVFNFPFTSPTLYAIAGQTANGVSHSVSAQFSADPSCANSTTYTAPVNCTPCPDITKPPPPPIAQHDER